MGGCKTENWTIQDLSSALQDMHKEKRKIVVPTFQRGKRWRDEQEKTFIDSLDKGYPVGNMLFYETNVESQSTYILVDGLQRGNTVKKYMNNPTLFFSDNSVSDDECSYILSHIDLDDSQYYDSIKEIIVNYIKQQKSFKNIQFYSVAKEILNALGQNHEHIEEIINALSKIFEDKQYKYDKISNTVIPVTVYSGDENTLPEIFDRINSKGTPLDKYEVYAASWPVNKRYVIENIDIVNYVIDKYKSFIEDGYYIHDFDECNMRKTKLLNSFEYLFGLGKLLVDRYPILSFNKNIAVDSVNPISFELVNACLNDDDKINILYDRLESIEINKFEKALFKAIEFVERTISIITKFKGNTRNKNKILHSKYQIFSLISATFKEMYIGDDFKHTDIKWESKKSILEKNLVHYYIFDIIKNYWGNSVNNKLYAATKNNRYLEDISAKRWNLVLDEFFEKSMERKEFKKVPNPQNAEIAILNWIYLKTFSAMDQLSVDTFDIEHIAPKAQVKKLLDDCHGDGLPISCIANLCYLPQYVNRCKRDKNFYQDDGYLKVVSLEEVENKYSFTTESDLHWMDESYTTVQDFIKLKNAYTTFCGNRFSVMKRIFLESLGISAGSLESKDDNMVKETSNEKDFDYKTNQAINPDNDYLIDTFYRKGIFRNYKSIEYTPKNLSKMKAISEKKPIENNIVDNFMTYFSNILEEKLEKLSRIKYYSIKRRQEFIVKYSSPYKQSDSKFFYTYNISYNKPRNSECDYLIYLLGYTRICLILPYKMFKRILIDNITPRMYQNVTRWDFYIIIDDKGDFYLTSRNNAKKVLLSEYTHSY